MNRNSSIPNRLAGALRAGLLAFSLALLLPAPTAFAESLREVAERVAREHDAKVISAREVERRGRKFYEIRILTRDGVVKTIRVPARDRSLSHVMPGPDRASSVRSIGPRPTLHLPGWPVKPAMRQARSASGNRA